MTDLTTPAFRPFAGPCAAVHCEAPAPASTEAERLDRLDRAGPAALASHELLACSGCASTPRRLPPPEGCAGSATTPATPCANRRSRATTCSGSRPCSKSTPAGWRRACTATAASPPPPTPAATPAARLRGAHAEVFAVLFLDTRHRVIAFEVLFRGTVDGASVHPREVVRRALVHNAAAVIFAHNHPSGVAEPSRLDRAITDRLVDALSTVDVRVLDHLVVGDGETVSFAERGWL